MVARYRVEHLSSYTYERAVAASFNEARLTPLHTVWQNRLDVSLAIEPMSWSHRYTDYWGSDVRVFEANGPHRSLEIRAVSIVELDSTRRPVPHADLEWSDVRNPTVTDEFVEYLAQTEFTAPPTEVADLALSLAADNPPAATAAAVCAAVHDALTYTAGATEVHTKAAEAWAARRGVCQDYAHLALGALRHAGIPARYVSGYLHPATEPIVGDLAIGESHAWVECWLGEWVAFDPTNLADVAERHIMVGTGRDYADVPPIKGIVAGPDNVVGLAVTVALTRVA